MTKAELAQALKRECNLINLGQAAKCIDTMTSVIINELAASGKFSVPGVGSLTVRDTAARKGRNPRTGATINIPAGKKVVFKPSAALENALQ